MAGLRHYWSLMSILWLLASCATAPPAPKVKIASGTRVGYWLQLDETPTHSHVGTTILNNFVLPSGETWPLTNVLRDALEQALRRQAGMEPVDLQAQGFRPDQLAGLVIQKDKEWIANAGKSETFVKLARQGIRAVVLVQPHTGLHTVGLECSQFGCTERKADGTGLYSRSLFMLDHYAAVPALSVQVYTLTPFANLAAYGEIKELNTLEKALIPLKGFADPDHMRVMTPLEWQPVRTALEDNLRSISQMIATALAGSRSQ